MQELDQIYQLEINFYFLTVPNPEKFNRILITFMEGDQCFIWR